ncbi:hypothetical protein ACFSWE_11400 [Leucobacter albus]|uniref:Addiction module toxin RelE n=1 Tax=Leucobacter albus TaxID=272210 RepID=A0ABW3TRB1_9MICO
MDAKLSMLPGFKRDFDALGTHALRKLTLEVIGHIKTGAITGKPLEALANTGDLSDCRKVYFDFPDRAGDKPRYRLVYRESHNEFSFVSIEMVAVGNRQNLDAYMRALKNLGRA